MEGGSLMQYIFAGERPPPPEPVPVPNAWQRFLPNITDHELIRLLRLVKAKFPALVPMSDSELAALVVPPLASTKPAHIDAHQRAATIAARLLEPAKIAFAFVNEWSRTDDLKDRSLFPSYFSEQCELWARSNAACSRDVDRWVFASVVAAGDVLFQLKTSEWEAVIGLTKYQYAGRRAGYAPSNDAYGRVRMMQVEPAWRQILRGERSLRDSSPAPELDRDPTSLHNMVRERWRSHI
jgi:hypothetical protein